MEPVFLSPDEILEIHEQQIERYGGSPGLRDGAGLESAVASSRLAKPELVAIFEARCRPLEGEYHRAKTRRGRWNHGFRGAKC